MRKKVGRKRRRLTEVEWKKYNKQIADKCKDEIVKYFPDFSEYIELASLNGFSSENLDKLGAFIDQLPPDKWRQISVRIGQQKMIDDAKQKSVLTPKSKKMIKTLSLLMGIEPCNEREVIERALALCTKQILLLSEYANGLEGAYILASEVHEVDYMDDDELENEDNYLNL